MAMGDAAKSRSFDFGGKGDVFSPFPGQYFELFDFSKPKSGGTADLLDEGTTFDHNEDWAKWAYAPSVIGME